MTERSSSSPPSLPRAVVRMAAGALPAEALAVLAGPVGDAVARAAGYGGRALSENTKRADALDWRAFCAWCELGGVVALPAAPVLTEANATPPPSPGLPIFPTGFDRCSLMNSTPE